MCINSRFDRPLTMLALIIHIGRLIGLLLLVSCTSEAETPQGQTNSELRQAPQAAEPTELVPSEWAPSLEQVQEGIEQELAAQPHQSQQALTQANQNLVDLADAQLFIVYILLLQKLDEKGKAELLKDQKAWLAQRTASAQAAIVSQGGSLAPLEYTSAMSDITKKRIAELEARLAQQSIPPGSSSGRGE